MKHAPLPSRRLADETAEETRRDHAAAITTLQRMPAASLVVVPSVTLESGATTRVPHPLGREPVFVLPSAPRGSGIASDGSFYEVREGIDRSKAVYLVALGWGATVTVDVLVL